MLKGLLNYQRANRILDFIGKELGLTIMPWIKTTVRQGYAVDEATGRRVVTRILLSMARKNGKTELMGALFNAHLFGPEARYLPYNSQLLSAAAGSAEQASMVYDSMVSQIKQNPRLLAIANIHKTTISSQVTGSFFKYMPQNARSLHGFRPMVWGFDELAQAIDSHLLGALQTADATAKEPMGFVFSTNSDRAGQPLAVLIDAVRKGQERGKMKHWLCKVYAPNPDEVEEKPFLIRHVRAANPSYGIVVQKETVRQEIEEARVMPTRMAEYRAYRLNLDVNEAAALIDIHKWRGCADPELTLEDMAGRPCIVSIDLSMSLSLSSMCMFFPDNVDNLDAGGALITESWVPNDAIEQLSETHGAPYKLWRDTDKIHVTAGLSVDLDTIIDRLLEVEQMVDVIDVRRDSYRVRELESKLSTRNTKLKPRMIQQGYKTLGPATDRFIKLVTTGGVRHDDNPVTNMCLRNTGIGRATRSVTTDFVPAKLRTNLPIDATIAMIECLAELEIEKPKSPGIVDLSSERFQAILAGA